MNQGMTPQALATELTRQLETKKDYKAPTKLMRVAMVGEGTGRNAAFNLNMDGLPSFGLTDKAHNQLGDWAGIPRKYYDSMRAEMPWLLAENLNAWLAHEGDTRLVRTIDGNARAFLSDRYRILDSYDLAQATLPAIQRAGAEIVSSHVNENRMVIKAVSHSIKIQVKVGDIVEAGVSISNSEIGEGTTEVAPFMLRLACLNGMKIPAAALRKYHVGRAGSAGAEACEMFKDETLQADDRAFFLKVRDVVEAAFARVRFAELAERMQEAAGQKITAPLPGIQEVVQKRFALTAGEGADVLANMMNDPAGAGYTRWGLANGITALANTTKDYDRATMLEAAGGEIITMENSEWLAIATA